MPWPKDTLKMTREEALQIARLVVRGETTVEHEAKLRRCTVRQLTGRLNHRRKGRGVQATPMEVATAEKEGRAIVLDTKQRSCLRCELPFKSEHDERLCPQCHVTNSHVVRWAMWGG